MSTIKRLKPPKFTSNDFLFEVNLGTAGHPRLVLSGDRFLFCSVNFKNSEAPLQLVDFRGKEWSMTIKRNRTVSVEYEILGWHEFVAENELHATNGILFYRGVGHNNFLVQVAKQPLSRVGFEIKFEALQHPLFQSILRCDLVQKPDNWRQEPQESGGAQIRPGEEKLKSEVQKASFLGTMVIKQEEEDEDNSVGEKVKSFAGVRIIEEPDEGPLPDSEECKLKWEKLPKTGKVKYLPVLEAMWRML